MIAMRRLDTSRPEFEAQLGALLAFETAQDSGIDAIVSGILLDVKTHGDLALLEYTRRFDRMELPSAAALEIPRAMLERARGGLPPAQRAALAAAEQRVRTYHEKQLARSWEYSEPDGTELGQQVTPLDRVGIYVPGGKAAYPSSVIMNAVPAKVAGVREIIMTVPTPDGERNDLVLAAALLCGVDRVFALGGAQAIAALAYGTKSIPRVDKIVGPGNAYVAEAKRQVFGEVGIDMVAGPSEILVIADGSANPDWVAMDLFSQAEHDESAQAILLSPKETYLNAVAGSIVKLLGEMPRRRVIEASLKSRGALILTRDLDEACAVANRIAPEHLELVVEDPEAWLPKLNRAGAVFLGAWSSEAIGDYCAGPNHVLPTAGTARFSSPLGVYDFQKRTSVIAVSRVAAAKLGRVAVILAEGEGLSAHARAAQMRFE